MPSWAPSGFTRVIALLHVTWIWFDAMATTLVITGGVVSATLKAHERVCVMGAVFVAVTATVTTELLAKPPIGATATWTTSPVDPTEPVNPDCTIPATMAGTPFSVTPIVVAVTSNPRPNTSKATDVPSTGAGPAPWPWLATGTSFVKRGPVTVEKTSASR